MVALSTEPRTEGVDIGAQDRTAVRVSYSKLSGGCLNRKHTSRSGGANADLPQGIDSHPFHHQPCIRGSDARCRREYQPATGVVIDI